MFNLHQLLNMIVHYLKISIRSLLKYRGVSFINILGLAISMACCLLIILFITDELSFDRFHPQAGQIHRVVKDFVNDDGSKLPDATTPPALAVFMARELPEVDVVTRVFPGWGNKYLFRYEGKNFLEEKVYRVDSNFFQVFNFPFIKGDRSSPFREINSILLTESMAFKYFGSEEAMGKVITSDLGDLKVTGVLKDVPANSHFHFDFLVSIRKVRGPIDGNWDFYNFYTYALVKPNTDMVKLGTKIQELYEKNNADPTNVFYTQPLTDIHLRSELKWELEPNSDIMYVYVFSMIGIFIILIAFINYINLTTARASLRIKEIGVRKVSGAIKSALIGQFLTESMLTASLAWFIAVPLAYGATPLLNQITQKSLTLWSPIGISIMLGALTAAVLLGLLAGIYPAIYLSSFKPVAVLKGMKLGGRNVVSLRKVLVVSQFTISIAMIAGTLIVVRQLNFIQKSKLGLNKDQVMVVQGASSLRRTGNLDALKNEIINIPGVLKLAGADGVLGGQNWTNNLRPQGSDNSLLVNYLTIGHEFLELMGISIKEGRGFSNKFLSDTLNNGLAGTTERKSGSIILNETAVKNLGIQEPVLGKYIVWGEDEETTYNLELVGVVKDFHFTTFRSEIKPFAFVSEPPQEGLLNIKLDPTNIQSNINRIEKAWNTFSPDRPFQYQFLDETFANLYQSEARFKKVFISITMLAIFISCLGLFALTSFVTTQRTKEIGIRKVLGASVSNITGLLSRDFLALILVAILVASPLAWWGMNKWLQTYVYRIDLNGWVFIISGGMAFLIAMITISVQAIKAAMLNPVNSLRTE